MNGGYVRIHLFVTGKGEREFLHGFLGSLLEGFAAGFAEPEFIGQHSPRKVALKQPLKVVGTQREVPSKLEEKLSLPAYRRLREDSCCLVIVIDDLEFDRAHIAQDVVNNYRLALDKCLQDDSQRRRAAVHLFVNMVEAYYFAHAGAVNSVLGTTLAAPAVDVETLRHPKNDLKLLSPGFDERRDGARIAKALDLDVVLGDPSTCRSLRTLVGWCVHRLGGAFGARWQLADGAYSALTRGQIPWPEASSS